MLGAREGAEVGDPVGSVDKGLGAVVEVGDPVGSVDKGSMLGATVGCNNVKRRCRMYHVSVRSFIIL